MVYTVMMMMVWYKVSVQGSHEDHCWNREVKSR